MAHTCDACSETFQTLTKLRLHDCPGPKLSASDHVTKIVEETGELTQGDVLETFPDESVSVEEVEELGEAEEIRIALPLMSGSPETGLTERIAVRGWCCRNRKFSSTGLDCSSNSTCWREIRG